MQGAANAAQRADAYNAIAGHRLTQGRLRTYHMPARSTTPRLPRSGLSLCRSALADTRHMHLRAVRRQAAGAALPVAAGQKARCPASCSAAAAPRILASLHASADACCWQLRVVHAQASKTGILRRTVAMAPYSTMMGTDAQAGQRPDMACHRRSCRYSMLGAVDSHPGGSIPVHPCTRARTERPLTADCFSNHTGASLGPP